MDKRTFIALAIILTVGSVFLFDSFYNEAKNTAITRLNEEQTIYLKQAARGIEDFFATWTRSLNSLSKMDAIIDNDAVGKRYIKLFYETNQEQIKSITRLDERGVILYNVPSSSSVGADISDQKHVRELLLDHKPVISDVFRAVEGFDSVSLHVPVFRGSVFKGSIGILINIESLAKRYLDVIKIGKTGYAWVVSRDGTQLYSPVPGVTGKSVFENIKEFPSLIVMVNDMLQGHEGTSTYAFDRIGDRNVVQTRKYAVYMPVQLGNTFWSVAVASAEQDVLSGLISFRNKLALVIGALFICGMAFSTLGAKAWFIVKEEEKRRKIERQLEDRLNFEKILTAISTQFINISIDRVDGEIRAAQQQICKCLGLDICALWQFSPDRPGNLVMTHLYISPDFLLEVPENMDAKESFPWCLEMMMKKEVIALSRITDAPAAAERDVDVWKHYGIKSNLTFPLFAGDGTSFGALSFNTLKEERDWPEELINELQVLSQIFANALNRKFIERNLLDSEGRLRDITFSMADWVWEVDENGVYTYGSEQGTKLFGSVIGKTPFDLMLPDEAKRVSAVFSEIAAKKAPIKDLENWNVGKDGERICLLTNGVPVLDGEGNLKGYRGVDKDITDRKRAEEDLRASEEKFRQFFKNVPDYCYIVSPQGNILSINDSALHLLGYEREELVGKPLALIYAPESMSKMEHLFHRWKEEGQLRNEEMVITTKNGEKRVVLLNSGTVKGKNGEILHSTSVQTDITERKQAEEALMESEAALRYAQQDLQRLAGRLIFAQEEELRRLSRELHDDLTQRLAVLAIDAGKLELDLNKKPEACPQISQKISQMKDQLIKVSEDVHNISRQIHPAILDDLGLVRAIESECAALMRRENIEIVFSNEDVPTKIGNGIALCLYRVLQESLKNVMTHSRAKSCKIFLKGADDTIRLTVTDDGVGFDPVEVRHRPGLGLSSMRERVQLVRGDFSIKSHIGKGTAINVIVPLAGSRA